MNGFFVGCIFDGLPERIGKLLESFHVIPKRKVTIPPDNHLEKPNHYYYCLFIVHKCTATPKIESIFVRDKNGTTLKHQYLRPFRLTALLSCNSTNQPSDTADKSLPGM